MRTAKCRLKRVQRAVLISPRNPRRGYLSRKPSRSTADAWLGISLTIRPGNNLHPKPIADRADLFHNHQPTGHITTQALVSQEQSRNRSARFSTEPRNVLYNCRRIFNRVKTAAIASIAAVKIKARTSPG